MQNDWIPAGSFWQISSFYLLSSTGMLIYWWKEDKCSHIVRTPQQQSIKQEWERSGTSSEQMSELLTTLQAQADVLLSLAIVILHHSNSRRTTGTIKQTKLRILGSFSFPTPQSNSSPAAASLALYKDTFLPEHVNVWIFPLWRALP